MTPETEVLLVGSFVGSMTGVGAFFVAYWTVGFCGRLWRACVRAVVRRRYMKATQYPGREAR